MAASGGASNVMFGINYPIANDLPATLLEASEAAAEFICVPLTPVAEPHADDQPAPRMQSATILSSQDWTMTVVGHTGSLLQLDSPDHAVRRQSEEQFKAELSWASHLSLPAIAVPLHSAACANLAATLNATLCSPLNSRIWIRVPLTAPSSGAADGDDTGEEEDTWRWWNTFRLLCKSSTRLSVALDLTANLPSPARLARWLGEPVRSIFIDTSWVYGKGCGRVPKSPCTYHAATLLTMGMWHQSTPTPKSLLPVALCSCLGKEWSVTSHRC
eukprot:m.314087 g.314087  ORF g.314087 m.314087 type:complete len:273 (-) comp19666_c0_seq2:34-852(-)